MLPKGTAKAFALDAKYYRFGATGNPKHLPPSSSINKQIAYGEHVNARTEFSGASDEAVQGIVADTRHLMRRYAANAEPQIRELAETILASHECRRGLGGRSGAPPIDITPPNPV